MVQVLLTVCIYCFILGSCIGSFCLVLVSRTIHSRSLSLKERSVCDNCNHVLSLRDLIPIFSYVTLGEKCRYCGKKMGKSYVIIECLFGIVFSLLSAWYTYGYISNAMTLEFALIKCLEAFVLVSLCFCIFCIDSKIMEIPDISHIILLVFAVVNIFILKEITCLESIIGFFCISLLLYILVLIIPDCFGGGDIKLFASAGAFLGWKHTLVLFMLSLIICVVGIVFNKSKKDMHIPFGPSIVLGLLLCFFFGDIILQVYLTWIGL